MNPLISVIVPVYNAEAYLHRCVDSLLAQTFRDFEILLIDDGSPDKSGDICDQYARQDDRIRVFHKGNGGVSSARQLGIELAKGEYSIHCDPDDWVETNMLEELYNKAKATAADMVICDFFVDSTQSTTICKQPIKSNYSNDVLIQLLENELHGSTCNKLIKHSLYSQYNVHFPNSIDYCEDYCVMIQLLQHKLHIEYLPKAFYHYNQFDNTESITRKKDIKIIRRVMAFIQVLEQLIMQIPNSERYIIIRKEFVLLTAATYKILPFKNIIKLYPELRNNRIRTQNKIKRIQLFCIRHNIPIGFRLTQIFNKTFLFIKKFY